MHKEINKHIIYKKRFAVHQWKPVTTNKQKPLIILQLTSLKKNKTEMKNNCYPISLTTNRDETLPHPTKIAVTPLQPLNIYTKSQYLQEYQCLFTNKG